MLVRFTSSNKTISFVASLITIKQQSTVINFIQYKQVWVYTGKN